MQIIVLGSAAGGGFPQWNCNCSNCAGVRAGTIVATPRTQSSIIAGSDEGSDWILLNASPDVLEQIRHTPVLQPNRGIRDSGIAGVILVDGQIDHATGLFMLRERGSPMPIWCTGAGFMPVCGSVKPMGFWWTHKKFTVTRLTGGDMPPRWLALA